MIHGLQIKDGKATYVSRFVRTSRLKQEEFFGGAKFMKVTNCLKVLTLRFLCLVNLLLYGNSNNKRFEVF